MNHNRNHTILTFIALTFIIVATFGIGYSTGNNTTKSVSNEQNKSAKIKPKVIKIAHKISVKRTQTKQKIAKTVYKTQKQHDPFYGIKKMHVVDTEDGHEYILHTWFDAHTLYFKYTIKPIYNGNVAEINPI